MRKIVDAVREWLRRSNERYALAGLSERQLRDVGLNRDLVQAEILKPFWRQ